ncbi:hypothetical protein NEFER03_0012 [Nematocida sp. LUAm3]|nr:hypothetical protein NEFER03_0012 [Nematocida sp. LUAm3]KAI5173494.1 hypothetical protein NEFER02_0010 [Nematocida sp. LUAm2]KAI5176687.1 hypothetical protein NEFER01_0012 [Nematocida sp. LUAm1]
MPEAQRKRKRKEDSHETRVKRTEDLFLCRWCLIQLRITNNFSCRCKEIFCAKHRYSEDHNCSYDYKKENMLRLEKENPKIDSSSIYTSIAHA